MSGGWSCAALVAAVVFAAGAGPAGAAASEQFYERAVMVAADAQCRLFTPELGSSLAAAEAQARGAALRGGASDTSLDEMEQRARGRVMAAGCGSPDIAVAATRVRQAFAGYIDTRAGKKLAYELVVNNVPIKNVPDILQVFQDEGTISAILWRDN